MFRDRCATCHSGDAPLQPKPTWGPHHIRTSRPGDVRYSEHLIHDFTEPERSAVLTAPLAGEADGRGICRSEAAAGQPAVPFRDRSDPDYQRLLSILREGAARLATEKRFDMPGFRPNEHYVREMKKYGILSADPDAGGPIDPYATDRAYWKSLWHRPESEKAVSTGP